MIKQLIYKCLTGAVVVFCVSACKTPALVTREVKREVPTSYGNGQDSTKTARLSWREYFADPYLKALIDTAISNNQELNITPVSYTHLDVYKRQRQNGGK